MKSYSITELIFNSLLHQNNLSEKNYLLHQKTSFFSEHFFQLFRRTYEETNSEKLSCGKKSRDHL